MAQRLDDGYVSYFRNTKADPGGRLHCTSALGAIVQNPFSLERFIGDGVPHVTVEDTPWISASVSLVRAVAADWNLGIQLKATELGHR